MIVTKKRNKLITRAFVYLMIKWRGKSSELNGIDDFLDFIIVEQHELAN